ncbi:MAG: isoprenylcysteine carboxylmethyltransferase family protein [Chloroflexi bacterium]|nr:isoprenylcysteine carboxylmethyltransferase family protein [Chloroflexota bacterium]
MNISSLEMIVGWLGGCFALAVLAVILFGILRGMSHTAGRTVGTGGRWLRSPWLYFLSAAFFFGAAWAVWIPLPQIFPPQTRAWMLFPGSLLYFPGLFLALWGRLTLGKNYFVSTTLGAQLFADQQLVTHGPYAIVRHPMYAGILLAELGALLIYHTWTTLFFMCLAPMLLLRARREEAALAAEFGAQWLEYCRRVPFLLPFWRR